MWLTHGLNGILSVIESENLGGKVVLLDPPLQARTAVLLQRKDA
ncbi:hypothetical protein [Pandoraea sp. SD6-2]|nr:hypothetical protein [Pandoraea sp. SD6-2]